MNEERPIYRFSSSFMAFFTMSIPIFWFFLGVIAMLSLPWWVILNVSCGIIIGILYTRQSYSLSRLWKLARQVWKSLFITFIVISAVSVLLFDTNLFDLQNPGRPPERILLGGLGFLVFTVIYGSSYNSVYLRHTQESGDK